MEKDHSIKISNKGYETIDDLLHFFKKRYGYQSNFSKKGILENSLRVYTQFIKQNCQDKKDDNSTSQEN